MLWPAPQLLSYLGDLRRVRARERLEEFNLSIGAARGEPDGVEAARRALEEAAGMGEPAGDIEDLAAALAHLE